ncbi:hypothetical protein JMJ77_0006313, partial [Colletotrichum scovillei]
PANPPIDTCGSKHQRSIGTEWPLNILEILGGAASHLPVDLEVQ